VCGDIYKLSSLFPGEYFSLVVSTQVFSYIKRLDKALEEINRVMIKGGRLLFTIGCTKYRNSWRDQLRRRIAGWVIEKHYFREYDEKELQTLLKKSGFEVEDIRFYTIHPLKEIHNQIVSKSNQNKFLKLWKEMEDLLVHDHDFREKGKPYCMSIFFECRKL
jgi:ubiquinone/menaquinone biosynthesis C-methylase UbiE